MELKHLAYLALELDLLFILEFVSRRDIISLFSGETYAVRGVPFGKASLPSASG